MIIVICRGLSDSAALCVTLTRSDATKQQPCQCGLKAIAGGGEWWEPRAMSANPSVILPLPGNDVQSLPLPSSDYPPETVLGVIAHYAETGNASAAGEAYNVPQKTAWDWINKPETKPLVAALRSAIRYNHANTLNRIMGMGLASTLERLEHGDPVMTRQGTVRMLPISGKDSMVITSIAMDKYQLMISGINEDQSVDRLDAIAARLEAATSKLHAIKTNKPAIVDAIPEGVSPPEPPVS